MKEREVKKIILTRPAVEAGERLGFLPGDMKEKLDPYLQPLYDALHDMLPFKKLETWIEDGTVQIAPLAFMRGRTLENAFVILDEAQNATISQLKMFLTRMGVSSKFIMTGDTTQIDLPRKNESGLLQAMRILSGIEGISIIKFDERDIVRHKLVKRIVRAYEDEESETDKLRKSNDNSCDLNLYNSCNKIIFMTQGTEFKIIKYKFINMVKTILSSNYNSRDRKVFIREK